ncbi:MAG: LYR motif-containing protein 4 [Thelocarpon impressellum]|nr:MAG: LYR motif-containing protein 4 [Thelocarpon impressellum]
MSVARLAHGDTAYQARSLYRSLLRQARQFAAYNFREYARRRTRDAFREHAAESDARRVQELMQKGLGELQMLKRQTVVSQFFQLDRLVVEGGASDGLPSAQVQVPAATQRRERTCLVYACPRLPLPPLLLLPCRYRPHGQSRRQGRGQVDHDEIEGLPVKPWRRAAAVVGAPPKPDTAANRSNFQGELPMPKDAHLLCPMSQGLLQAARAGRVNKPGPPEGEAKEGGEDGAARGPDLPGFVATKWQTVPANVEWIEPEYLAKRRKGLPPQGLGVVRARGIKRTRVRRLDSEGNGVVEEVVVADGQSVHGEIVGDVSMTDGVYDDPVQATPPQRKRGAPKKKKVAKKGRKGKIVTFTPAEEMKVEAVNGVAPVLGAVIDGDGPKPESGEALVGGDEGDSAMPDALDDAEEGDGGGDDDEDEGEVAEAPPDGVSVDVGAVGNPVPTAETAAPQSPSKTVSVEPPQSPEASPTKRRSVDQQMAGRDRGLSVDGQLASPTKGQFVEPLPSPTRRRPGSPQSPTKDEPSGRPDARGMRRSVDPAHSPTERRPEPLASPSRRRSIDPLPSPTNGHPLPSPHRRADLPPSPIRGLSADLRSPTDTHSLPPGYSPGINSQAAYSPPPMKRRSIDTGTPSDPLAMKRRSIDPDPPLDPRTMKRRSVDMDTPSEPLAMKRRSVDVDGPSSPPSAKRQRSLESSGPPAGPGSEVEAQMHALAPLPPAPAAAALPVVEQHAMHHPLPPRPTQMTQSHPLPPKPQMPTSGGMVTSPVREVNGHGNGAAVQPAVAAGVDVAGGPVAVSAAAAAHAALAVPGASGGSEERQGGA